MRNPSRIIQIGHSCFERIDRDIIKQLCVTCGGKGFYLEMIGFPDKTDPNRKGELVSCDCEQGFKYSKLIKEKHGHT